MTRVDGQTDWLRILGISLITGAGFFLLGYGGIEVSGHGRMIALIWPANAFVVCMMVRLSRSRLQDMAMLAATLVAETGINVAVGAPPLLILGFAIVSLIEIAASLIAVRHFGPKRFRDVRGGLQFLGAAVILPALMGALLAAGTMVLAGNPDWLTDSRHWFAANVLGFCIVLPIGLAFSWRKLAKLRLRQRAIEASLVFAALTLISLYALRWSAHPMPFIILPATLVATVRFRLLGAGTALLLVLVIALVSVQGSGNEFTARVEMIQAFLAVASVVCARAAMLLNERDVHLALIEGRRRSAVRASRFKSQLLAHVGQEARGPLQAIIGISTVLESGKLAPDRAQEFAHVVAHNGELLQRLYADLLDLARAESGGLAIRTEKVPVGQTLKHCIGAIRLDAALGGKSVLLGEVEGDFSVQADPVRLSQIINHLIANSYKYGDNDSPIRVRASRLGDGFGRIEIMNMGPGIPLVERDTMFLPFNPGSGGRTVPGAGIGLSIARLLAERQGGRVDFESIPGRQTRFWLDLPLAA